ncbi:hypothetical protein [Streptomyces spinoverrucosus]|nr:hypothetical protein [Streptomyces spinoverrucosus]
MRYTPEEIDRLLRIAWWNWPPGQVTQHVRTLMDGSVDALKDAARQSGAGRAVTQCAARQMTVAEPTWP